jgi:SAM-dependent methyltransferase
VSGDADAPGERWESFAQDRPLSYVDPALGRGVSAAEFIAAGEPLVERELGWVGPLAAYDRALEIGCGVGRNTVHLARHFERVDGVDVSPTMIRLAQQQGLPDNVTLCVTSGRDLAPFEDRSFSFVFSHLVFQHVAERAVIEAYVREIARVLAADGIALVQFDTRPETLLSIVARGLPDAMLPATRRRGIRRNRLPATLVREYALKAGLTLAGERNPDTAEHWFRWGSDTSGSAREQQAIKDD